MKTPRSVLLRRVLGMALIIILLIAPASGVSANVRVPGGIVPFYARLGLNEYYHTDDWAAVVFYRPPTCIPPDFNLLDFFDVPDAFDCNPPTTAGFEIWEHDPLTDPDPKMTELKGLGAVPVWFVGWPALQVAMADNMLTIGELGDLHPLIGSASDYHETLRPTGGVNVSTIEINARGTLADGQFFTFHAISVGSWIRASIVFR
jgi:hypothetical protein